MDKIVVSCSLALHGLDNYFFLIGCYCQKFSFTLVNWSEIEIGRLNTENTSSNIRVWRFQSTSMFGQRFEFDNWSSKIQDRRFERIKTQVGKFEFENSGSKIRVRRFELEISKPKFQTQGIAIDGPGHISSYLWSGMANWNLTTTKIILVHTNETHYKLKLISKKKIDLFIVSDQINATEKRSAKEVNN